MSTRDLKGLYSALLVAFDENGNINEKGLRQIVRHNIDVCKMDGLCVGGSTGENFMLSTEEKKRIFEIAKDEAKDDITLIAQVGSINLKESVELAKFVTDLGYDAISAVTPFYYKFSFDEIKYYYETIIKDVDNRMIIYSIPFLTGVDMSLAQFGELFANPKIVGIKAACRRTAEHLIALVLTAQVNRSLDYVLCFLGCRHGDNHHGTGSKQEARSGLGTLHQ